MLAKNCYKTFFTVSLDSMMLPAIFRVRVDIFERCCGVPTTSSLVLSPLSLSLFAGMHELTSCMHCSIRSNELATPDLFGVKDMYICVSSA